jgi:hypothetical protein
MITAILITVAALAAIFIAIVASRPNEFRITRSALIAAPPAVVFDQVNDVQRFQAWSPWAKRDPNARTTFEGPRSGTGAVFKWAGNKELGEGIMTLIDSQPHELVRFRLEFLKPFAATNTAEFTFARERGQTRVTWSMFGQSRFLCKAIGLFMNMDEMCGRDFEKGLASVREIAEAISAAAPSPNGKHAAPVAA